MTNWKNLQIRLLKQCGDKEGMPSKFKWSLSCQTSQKLIKAKRDKEVVLKHVWLSGIRALLGTNSQFWPGPLL
jgi:hypothetical protein